MLPTVLENSLELKNVTVLESRQFSNGCKLIDTPLDNFRKKVFKFAGLNRGFLKKL